jgi:hypothetical protein
MSDSQLVARSQIRAEAPALQTKLHHYSHVGILEAIQSFEPNTVVNAIPQTKTSLSVISLESLSCVNLGSALCERLLP